MNISDFNASNEDYLQEFLTQTKGDKHPFTVSVKCTLTQCLAGLKRELIALNSNPPLREQVILMQVTVLRKCVVDLLQALEEHKNMEVMQ